MHRAIVLSMQSRTNPPGSVVFGVGRGLSFNQKQGHRLGTRSDWWYKVEISKMTRMNYKERVPCLHRVIAFVEWSAFHREAGSYEGAWAHFTKWLYCTHTICDSRAGHVSTEINHSTMPSILAGLSSLSSLRQQATRWIPRAVNSTSCDIVQVRTATKKAGGTTKNHGKSPGQRLGIKKFSGRIAQFGITGNILVRQRGTQFHPGQHVGIGKDHTLFALAPGYVRYYTLPNPTSRGQRRYVGIVQERGEKLPRYEIAHGRSRYFGLVELSTSNAASQAKAS
ncbi:ribosomal l27 domain-containing protein [Rhizoctonia solani AG-1 IA]|uniref:Large ribosomal subunit protein bL27m n=1 Tax=Thanatephorus cucumeris (strain AG1-IA) TaxID=983506 RepID=L8X488_THACA|nr:ribosomal l27 domain-containing protein [Rhizoctonia solani AG-1 IA]